MVDVVRDNGTTSGYFAADKFGRNFVFWRIGSKALAGVLALHRLGLRIQLFDALVFTNGDVFHFGSDDALFGVV